MNDQSISEKSFVQKLGHFNETMDSNVSDQYIVSPF